MSDTSSDSGNEENGEQQIDTMNGIIDTSTSADEGKRRNRYVNFHGNAQNDSSTFLYSADSQLSCSSIEKPKKNTISPSAGGVSIESYIEIDEFFQRQMGVKSKLQNYISIFIQIFESKDRFKNINCFNI